MTSIVAGYANKVRRGEIKSAERRQGAGEGRDVCSPLHRRLVKYEKIKRGGLPLRRRSVYRDDRKNSHAVRPPALREGRRSRREARRRRVSVKNAFPGGVLTLCHTKTLWTMAHPQNTMPRPMKTDVTIAGVEWNWMNVYRIMPTDRT